MIGRRNIRVKVMQALYTLATTGVTTPEEQKKKGAELLDEKLARFLDLFVISVLYTMRVAQYAEKDAGKRASKYLPTSDDLNVNTKISGNDFLWKILNNETFTEKIKDKDINRYLDEDLVKKIYKRFVETHEYESYTSVRERDPKIEVAIIKYIWDEQIYGDESVMEYFTDELPGWEDDMDMVKILMDNFFKSSSRINFLKLISAEKNEYAHNLLVTTIEKEEYCVELIQPKLVNWDSERVALIDMLLLRMGVCELLYFPTIPTKVTINEYIEIAKLYSTPQSGQFVNGVLDNILKDLAKENKIHKEQRNAK
ncbi:MAG: transcription antitermination factor NusB [Chitinophagaceae bacterium]|nr:transcription antitermination factor NusB [Chitinophagaceae bacterium]